MLKLAMCLKQGSNHQLGNGSQASWRSNNVKNVGPLILFPETHFQMQEEVPSPSLYPYFVGMPNYCTLQSPTHIGQFLTFDGEAIYGSSSFSKS